MMTAMSKGKLPQIPGLAPDNGAPTRAVSKTSKKKKKAKRKASRR
jgi:hypothetical protein